MEDGWWRLTLVVANPKEGDPEENGAGIEASGNLVDPRIVKRHPLGSLSLRDVARLDPFPKGPITHVPPSLEGVPGPPTTLSTGQETEGVKQSRLSGRNALVLLAASCHDDWTDCEQNRGQQEGNHETVLLLGKDHAKLAGKSTQVDEHVEVAINPGCRGGRIDDDLFTLAGHDAHAVDGDLFHHKWVDLVIVSAD